VTAIVCNGDAALATKAAAPSIPIVFVTGDDPVRQGFVASLRRPTANLIGVTFFGGGQLAAKRVELLRDLVPKAVVIAVLMDPRSPSSEAG
jgi:putative tryptophan/tyrosine transport system substrate-binding protein